jgi:predicted transcriptional regulator
VSEVKVIVGSAMEEDAADLLDPWHRTEQGEAVAAERVLAFESWEGLFKVLTGERFRLLRHLHQHPEPSISALARALSRQYSRVHTDVVALQAAGLVARSDNTLRTTTDRILADIRL